jgi:hypothetical protein
VVRISESPTVSSSSDGLRSVRGSPPAPSSKVRDRQRQVVRLGSLEFLYIVAADGKKLAGKGLFSS